MNLVVEGIIGGLDDLDGVLILAHSGIDATGAIQRGSQATFRIVHPHADDVVWEEDERSRHSWRSRDPG